VRTLKVLPLGATVTFGPHQAKVLRVQISAGRTVVYEIGYFVGLEWKELWVNAFTLTPSSEQRMKIGF
jgi:hypothetical protein